MDLRQQLGELKARVDSLITLLDRIDQRQDELRGKVTEFISSLVHHKDVLEKLTKELREHTESDKHDRRLIYEKLDTCLRRSDLDLDCVKRALNFVEDLRHQQATTSTRIWDVAKIILQWAIPLALAATAGYFASKMGGTR